MAVAHTKVPFSRFVFVDYGGGTGILALLAKELGIGTVIYNDIYEVSCQDAQRIGETIHIEADHYVHGDIDELQSFLDSHAIIPNALASYDVIEHIYDIDEYLVKLAQLSSGAFSVVLASGANPHNPIIRTLLMRRQKRTELEDRTQKWGHKKRDSLRSYLAVREEMIRHLAPTLDKEEILRLAKMTRGLMETDIENNVNEYLQSGTISYKPDHPTNTCDPYTGNWTEHLMDLKHLRNVLIQGGFQVNILSGFYGDSSQWKRQLISYTMNPVISLLRQKGLWLAPYYVLFGRKSTAA